MRNPYLLLQSRDATDPMRAHEVECFAQTLGIAAGGIRVVDMLDRVPTEHELASSRAVLLGGSGDYSSLDPFPWIRRMVGYVRDVLIAQAVPTFGSCFGLQIATLALNGRMMRDPANREIGSIDVTTTPAAAADPVFAPLPSPFVVQAGHTDRAVETPPGATLLASTPTCPVNAFRVAGKPFWATQFHPELDPDSVATRYMVYMEKYPPPDLPPGTPLSEAPFLKRLRPSPHATRLLQRFAQWCRVHGDASGARVSETA